MGHLKYLLLTIVAFMGFSSLAFGDGFHAFVNKNGVYLPFNEKTDIVNHNSQYPKGTFAYYRESLGFLNNELVTPYDNKYCYFIAINPFNNKVEFIIPMDTTKTKFTQDDVNMFLDGYNYSVSDFATNLDNGVKSKSIRQSFIEKSLGTKAVNNKIKDNAHGYTYTFSNGYLSGYESASGLSKDAIYVQEHVPSIFNKILENASANYSGSNIEKYINGQCKYFMKISITYLNRAPNYNYALLYAILDSGITLEEFSFLVPEAEITSSAGNYIMMSVGTYSFTFKDKVLVK